jgi:hypothetical protein
MLLHLALLHRGATMTVLALFPSLRLTFSLHCVLGRFRKMAKMLLVRRYLVNLAGFRVFGFVGALGVIFLINGTLSHKHTNTSSATMGLTTSQAATTTT